MPRLERGVIGGHPRVKTVEGDAVELIEGFDSQQEEDGAWDGGRDRSIEQHALSLFV